MFPWVRQAPGLTLGPLNVVQVPGPVGPLPVTLPSQGELAMALDGVLTVLDSAAPVLHLASSLPLTSGDEAGTLGGVVSGTQLGAAKPLAGSVKVFVRGKPALLPYLPWETNGSPANCPLALCVTHQAGKVFVSS